MCGSSWLGLALLRSCVAEGGIGDGMDVGIGCAAGGAQAMLESVVELSDEVDVSGQAAAFALLLCCVGSCGSSAPIGVAGAGRRQWFG